MKLLFDAVYYNNFDNKQIEYGVKFGNNTIVFIKVGFNGSIYGYNNKYLEIANKLNEIYGYTVIVSSNPSTRKNPLDVGFEIINKVVSYQNIKEYNVYYVGYSNGAMIGSRWGYLYNKIKKMLLINSPIMFNWPYQKEGLLKSKAEDILIVYSEYDQSIEFIELIKKIINNKIKLKIIPNTDHMFTNMKDKFISCIINYLK
ncbi:MAG: alpha/beta hydrolase [Mollicutes bacterium]|nr:alpha/beta hydrolase [Mollicutes bacterium]